MEWKKTSGTWCCCILFQVHTFAVQHVQWTATDERPGWALEPLAAIPAAPTCHCCPPSGNIQDSENDSNLDVLQVSTTSLCPKMIGFYQIQTINCKIYLPFAANVQQRVSIHASNCLISVVCRVSLSNWVKKFKHVCSKVSLESSSTRACGWCDKPSQAFERGNVGN